MTITLGNYPLCAYLEKINHPVIHDVAHHYAQDTQDGENGEITFAHFMLLLTTSLGLPQAPGVNEIRQETRAAAIETLQAFAREGSSRAEKALSQYVDFEPLAPLKAEDFPIYAWMRQQNPVTYADIATLDDEAKESMIVDILLEAISAEKIEEMKNIKTDDPNVRLMRSAMSRYANTSAAASKTDEMCEKSLSACFKLAQDLAANGRGGSALIVKTCKAYGLGCPKQGK